MKRIGKMKRINREAVAAWIIASMMGWLVIGMMILGIWRLSKMI